MARRELAEVQPTALPAPTDHHCPICLHDENTVVEHRGIRRRRECRACRHRWTTYEVTAERLELLEELERHALAIAEAVKEPT